MPIQTILVPLDGSRLARRIVPTAAALARACGARLYLLSVADASQLDLEFYYQQHALPISQEIQLRLGRYLEQVRRSLERDGITVETEVIFGRPAEEIVRVARRERADLIALSTHGRSGLGRWAQGSVAAEVIRSGHVPVLALRPGPRAGAAAISRILTPLDGSPVAEAALLLTAEVARSTGAHVTLVQVAPTLTDLTLGPLWSVAPEGLEQQASDAAGSYLEETAARLREQGIAVETRVLRGDPARELLKATGDGAVDLIVMATHGRTGLRRWLLGSVTDRVVREAARPVLLVYPPGAEQQ